jgi:hypothetical protein
VLPSFHFPYYARCLTFSYSGFVPSATKSQQSISGIFFLIPCSPLQCTDRCTESVLLNFICSHHTVGVAHACPHRQKRHAHVGIAQRERRRVGGFALVSTSRESIVGQHRAWDSLGPCTQESLLSCGVEHRTTVSDPRDVLIHMDHDKCSSPITSDWFIFLLLIPSCHNMLLWLFLLS